MTLIRLIAGLGNPGREHERDRHNAGFWFIERLASRMNVTLAREPKYQALVTRVGRSDDDLWLVMPQTYMNVSGRAVGTLAAFYKIAPGEILVVHDELDFPPGTVKMKLGGGVAGHNGLKDIAARLGSREFWRVRVGIGHPGDRDVVGDYVLSKPSAEDRKNIEASLERAIEVMPLVLSGDMAGAMQALHTKPGTVREKPARAGAPLPERKED